MIIYLHYQHKPSDTSFIYDLANSNILEYKDEKSLDRFLRICQHNIKNYIIQSGKLDKFRDAKPEEFLLELCGDWDTIQKLADILGIERRSIIYCGIKIPLKRWNEKLQYPKEILGISVRIVDTFPKTDPDLVSLAKLQVLCLLNKR